MQSAKIVLLFDLVLFVWKRKKKQSGKIVLAGRLTIWLGTVTNVGFTFVGWVGLLHDNHDDGNNEDDVCVDVNVSLATIITTNTTF